MSLPEDVPMQLRHMNLLDMPGPCIIAHQCNTTKASKDVQGLARQVFEKYPSARYNKQEQDLGNVGIHCVNAKEKIWVANLFAQRYPGSPNITNDNPLMRRHWFQFCIEAVLLAAQRLGIPYVAVPYGIGCGLAGGSWPQYQARLALAYSNIVKEGTPRVQVVICKYP